MQLTKSVKGTNPFLQMTSGDNSYTFRSKSMTGSGLQLKCKDEVLEFNVEDADTEVVNIKMSTEDPK